MRDCLKDFQKGLVSVIIPTYNRSALLKEAIMSVYHQTYRPIECIVVDDGSIDETDAVVSGLKELQDFGFNLLYLKQENSGAQVARNTGTVASGGEFIQYLDSDDLLFPDKLMQQMAYLIRHPECDGVFGDWKTGLPDDNILVRGYASENMIDQFLGDRCIHTLSFLMRRNFVLQVGGWDPEIRRNQEIDFHIRGILLGGQFHYQPGCSGLWRHHRNERIVNTTNLFDILFFYQKMERLLTARNLFTKEIKETIAAQYVWFLSEYKNRPDTELITVMKEAVRLQPDIAFYKSRKLRLLQSITGQNIAFRIWLERFRRTTKVTQVCQL